MIFHDALRSMKKDPLRCFFYWLTFLLTTMLIFLFENISMSYPQPTAAQFGMSLSVGVMILVVIVCSLDIFFANSFYVKSKAKEMAVRLICGATFGQIASFLLLQTILLLLLAVPAGIALSFACMPLISNIMKMMTGSYTAIAVHGDAVFISAVIILYIIFWTVLLNLSFAYKNAAGMLMNAGTLLGTNQGSVLHIGLINDKASGAIGLILFILPVILFYFQPEAIVFLTVLGMAGLYLFNKNGMSSLITGNIHKHISSSLMTAEGGLVRRDLIVLNQNILLYLIVASILSSLLTGHLDNPGDSAMLLVSYIFMTFLQSMTLMFRFASECAGRKQHFRIFHALGYMQKEQKRIITREIGIVFGLVILASLLYSINMMSAFMMHSTLQLSTAAVLILIQVLPFVLWGIIDRAYYIRAVEL